MLDSIIHIIDYFGLNHKKTGEFIYYIHFILAIIIGLIIFLSSDKRIILFFILLTILHNISYIYFNGCIITKLEYKLTNENYTIIDPFLKILNIKITGKNRHYMTLLVAGLTWIILICKIIYLIDMNVK